MREITIGLLGFGIVGAGVVEGLQENGDVLAERLGARLVLGKIADIDLESDRGVKVDRSILTQDAESVVNDPTIDIIIELIGGTDAARDLVIKALKLRKPVVTANKALLAEYAEEIFGLAKENETPIYFGASVGGGIPIIRALREGLIANRIDSIHGILNGTCNYILTRMENEQIPFSKALEDAQAEGYAEADPGLDIDGFDTAHKAVILASLAYGFFVPLDKVYIEGIRGLSETDIRYAGDLGYRVKLLAVIKRGENEVEVRVHPTLMPANHVMASVSGVFNAVMLRGNMAGDTLYYGRGAGRKPTASTVISDVADAARNLGAGDSRRISVIAEFGNCARIRDIHEIECRYYLRLSLMDEPGVLARIAAILGEHGISIASVLQKKSRVDKYVPVIIVTHIACGEEMETAIKEIDMMDVVGAKTVRLRIEG